jgi:hypothetical protein
MCSRLQPRQLTHQELSTALKTVPNWCSGASCPAKPIASTEQSLLGNCWMGSSDQPPGSWAGDAASFRQSKHLLVSSSAAQRDQMLTLPRPSV